MNDFLKHSRFIGSILLCTLPAGVLHSEPLRAAPSFCLQNLFTEERTLSYDAIVDLLEQLESGALDGVCSPEDWEQISRFLAYLARQGTLDSNSDVDKVVLELDIQELLSPDLIGNSYFLGSERVSIAPAIYYGDRDAILCKSWLSKRWQHVRSFIKHHKTAVIIGTALVVAAVAIVVTATAISSTAAAAAVAAAADSSSNSSNQKNLASSSEAAQSIDEQVSVLKTVVEQSDLPLTNEEETGLFDKDNGRATGSALAHEAINAIGDVSDQAILTGHGKTDDAFSTDLSSHYLEGELSQTSWQKNLYEHQGELALKQGNYEQAAESFGKAIELDPQNRDAYLQRAYALMGSEQYDQSLIDYSTFLSQESQRKSLPSAIDFGVGLAQNLSKGVGESGLHLLSFAANLIAHPIDTTCNVCSALSTLAQLGYSQEWSTLKQVIAPEICQLAEQWDGLSRREQGERVGYILGKYGGDILIPGAAGKVLSKGIEGAKELVLVAKNLQIAEQTLALEGLAQSASNAGALGKLPVQFKTAERCESAVQELPIPSKSEQLLRDRGVWEFYEKFQKAQEALKPYQKQYLPEEQIRNLIHETGIPTFQRPRGIPENFRVTLSDKGAGMKYVHPKDPNTYVRVMPGKPHSPWPHQQKPYVSDVKNGQYFDKHGNMVPDASPEAHIPLEEFKCRW